MMLALTALTLGMVALSVAWLFRLGAPPCPPPRGFIPPTSEEMKRHLMWGLFYVNPADPRGWVPKINGLGYTVNFRSERNARRFAFLIGATLLSAAALSVVAVC